jgi:hypothetical protein
MVVDGLNGFGLFCSAATMRRDIAGAAGFEMSTTWSDAPSGYSFAEKSGEHHHDSTCEIGAAVCSICGVLEETSRFVPLPGAQTETRSKQTLERVSSGWRYQL